MSIVETFHGYIETTQDCLLVFEACRRCLLPKISRRLQEKERKLVRSGSVFVFDEKESGIKRWTDGLVWSPSRILGNFLIYRELDKRKEKRKNSLIEIGKARQRSNSADYGPLDRSRERQLVGSLSEAYNFKDDGLIKKTMSLVVNGSHLHLVSYYHPDDVIARRFRTPSAVPEIANLEISPELLIRQNFRIPPMVEPDQRLSIDASSPLTPTSLVTYAGGLGKPTTASRSMSLPSGDYRQRYYSQNQAMNYHRMSFDVDRKQLFDPMYSMSGYNLPSPTSSPTTPLPSPASKQQMRPSLKPYQSAPAPYLNYARPPQKPNQQDGHILNLSTGPRQDHTSITSLLTDDLSHKVHKPYRHPYTHPEPHPSHSPYYVQDMPSLPSLPALPPTSLTPTHSDPHPNHRLNNLDDGIIQWI